MKIRKGDKVKVLSGKDRGKEGEVTRVIPEKNRVIVQGVNTAKKHKKSTQQARQGGIIDRDMPIDASNVALIGSNGKPTRVGYRIDASGKHRIDQKSGNDI